jgi:hypothetical protein
MIAALQYAIIKTPNQTQSLSMTQQNPDSSVNQHESTCCTATKQEPAMDINKVGKFEALKIVNEFDNALIELYGINMTDARITRYEALSTIEETRCVRKAAELFGAQRGMPRLGGSQA